MIDLSIIIVSYNTEKLLQNCLHSLYNSLNFAGLTDRSEIIVVDNASTDGTVNMLIKKFPKVKIIKNSYNAGFGTANNQGIKISKGNFILLLNSDTKLFPETMKDSLKEIKKDVGVLGVKLINEDGKIQPSAGFFPTLIRVFNWMFFIDDIHIIRDLIKPYHVVSPDFYNKKQIVDWVTGAFFLTRREVILQAGLFDERMFMYVEEIDLCYRIKKKGWQIIYSPSALLIHKKGGSGIGRNSGIIEELRGIEYFYQKNYGKLFSFLVKSFLKAGALLRSFFFAIINKHAEKRKLYLRYLGLVR